MICHALSLMYHVQLSFTDTVLVFTPVRVHVFRANGSSGYHETLSHVTNLIVTVHVVQLFHVHQFQLIYSTSHVGHVLSILYTHDLIICSHVKDSPQRYK